MRYLFSSTKWYYHMYGLFFDYKKETYDYFNEYLQDNWRCDDTWFVFIRLEPTLFDYESINIQGHTVSYITVLGITVGKGYTYDAYSIKERMNQ